MPFIRSNDHEIVTSAGLSLDHESRRPGWELSPSRAAIATIGSLLADRTRACTRRSAPIGSSVGGSCVPQRDRSPRARTALAIARSYYTRFQELDHDRAAPLARQPINRAPALIASRAPNSTAHELPHPSQNEICTRYVPRARTSSQRREFTRSSATFAIGGRAHHALAAQRDKPTSRRRAVSPCLRTRVAADHERLHRRDDHPRLVARPRHGSAS